MNLNDKNVKLFMISLGLVMVISIVVGLLMTLGDSDETPEDAVEWQYGKPTPRDVRNTSELVTPIYLDDITINYSPEGEYYTAEYPGFMSDARARFEVAKFFQENTDLLEINIRFGNISAAVETLELYYVPSESDAPTEENVFDGTL